MISSRFVPLPTPHNFLSSHSNTSQLFHVKSGKYLKVIPDQLAKDERENIRIVLDPQGNSFSWIQVIPRYKIDREGDRVLNASEIYLKISERSNEFIHRADRPPLPGQDIEVNCSLEPTSWKLNIFRSSVDSVDHRLLLSSELVYISDPETRCALTLAPVKLETLIGDDVSIFNSTTSQSHQDDNIRDIHSDFDMLDGSNTENNEFTTSPGFHDYGDVILQSYSEYLSSDFLWFVEVTAVSHGGPIKSKIDRIRFKQMNTGKYLKMDQVLMHDEDTGESSERWILTSTFDASDPNTVFSVTEIANPGKFLTNAKALQIGTNGQWIERGALENGNYIVKSTEDKSMSVALLINRFSSRVIVDSSLGAVAIEELDSSSKSTEPLDAFVGLSIRSYLQKYLVMTVLPKSDHVNTLWPTANRGDMPFFQSMIQKVILFSQGFPISAENVLLGIDKGNAKLRMRRQSLLREQGTIEVVLRLINKLIPITERADAFKNLPKKHAPILESELSAIEMGRVVLSECFQLLYYVILDNTQNQIYVADFMPSLLAHLSSQPMAGKCVTEMLSKNWELQETKIGTREIRIFVDKLRSSKMNALYLQLLQSCCSCEGNGVDGNQGKVAEMLFSDTNDIIIQIHADYIKAQSVHWERGLYIPSSPIPGSPLRADFLLTKGMPKLSLAWTTNSIDFSPLGLFGKLSVNVEELFGNASVLRNKLLDTTHAVKATAAGATGGSNKKQSMGGKKNTIEQKLAVANYLVAEMFLGAEMCMDRNYIAMHKLDALFSYEVLVTILKMDLTNDIKSAAVRLLMCQHIDRDPQATTTIPMLTRAWTDIEKHDEPQLPNVDAGRRFNFGLVQQLISEHLRSMSGARWDELSRHMVKLLRALVEFNFYGTNERMKDVIEPLVAALDRRNVVITESHHHKRRSSADAATAAASVELFKRTADAQQQQESKDESLLEDSNMNDDEDDDQDAGKESLITRISSFFTSFFGYSRISDDTEPILVDENDDNSTSGDGKVATVKVYHVPARYAKAPTYELETMVEIVDILAFAQKVIEDRNLSLLMRYFYLWVTGNERKSPAEIFNQVMEDSKELTMEVANFDDVMIDILMFEHNDLVQSALEVLMAHHSKQLTLLSNLNSLQLLASPSRERQFRIVDQMLKQLEQNAETQELWGELQTDADRAVNKQTHDILEELIDICRVRRTELDVEDGYADDDFKADADIQDLFRNLGCFSICQKVLGLLDSVEEEDAEDGGDSHHHSQVVNEGGKNTIELCLLCNTLLYWFLIGNDKNQEMGYGELDFFIETLDKDINSHLVIRAIFKNNEFLMRQVPHSYLNQLVNQIIDKGKSHHYLTLLSTITHVGDRNIYENQLEICKTLTSAGPLKKVSCYFVPVDHPEYIEKRNLMEPYLHLTRDVSLEELPPLLAYHLVFLEVLSGCTVGSKNMTTIEAKVQSVYNYEHLLQSILDVGSITICKIRLSKFFFNSVIDVDLKIPGVEQSPEIWRLLESYRSILSKGREQMELIAKVGWDGPGVTKQKVEYMFVCIMIVGGFFEYYFQSTTFQHDSNSHSSSSDPNSTRSPVSKVQFSLTHVDELIIYFFTKIKEIYDLDSPRLAASTKRMLYRSLVALNTSISGENPIVNYIKPPSDLKVSKSMAQSSVTESNTVTVTEAEEENEFEVFDDPEKELLSKFYSFRKALTDSYETQQSADNENVAFIKLLEALAEDVHQHHANGSKASDVKYEMLIQKLVFHIRENIKMVNNQKRMDARVTATSTWIIRAFRTMIENKMEMTIYVRDEEGGEKEDANAAPVVKALNECGATTLCLDLIADGIDEKLQLEAIKLGVGLLFKEGGALEVQGIMHNHLMNGNSELFFRQMRITLQKLQAWHEWNNYERQVDGTAEKEPPKKILVVRFLQLMCEGHYLRNQDIMRDQPFNRVSYNILDDLVNYFNFLSSSTACRINSQAAIRVSATILEVIQGPCLGNQQHFALNTELIETLNRVNRARLENDCVAEEQIELKKTSIDIFQALLEAQAEKSAIYERVLSVIHLDIIQQMSNGEILQGVDGEEKGGDDEESAEEKEILQTECVVLLQMLRNFKPALARELGISEDLEDIVGSGTALIEVVWRGELYPRFFHVPRVCSYLAKTSKDGLVEFVDRMNPESKLVDFLNRAQELYLEVKHQEFLTKQNLARVFSRENQNRATWITFILAMIINTVILFSYEMIDGHPTIKNNQAKMIVSILNIIQIIVAFFVLVLFLVVRIPVKYQSLTTPQQNQKYSRTEALFYTMMEPMTLYYIWYLSFSILGQVYKYDFLTFLLMDIIVKNSTTRDVLNAVVFPRKQIAMGGIVILIIVQIYSFFLFFYFRNETVDQANGFCNTLWGCYLTTLGYGLRQGGGVGDVFDVSVNKRWVLDITYYFVITVGMLNLIGGVIITTFGQLREKKARRVRDTIGVCFICGIDKQIFDRASDKPDGFQTHIKLDHNMWNYLYFIFLLWEQDKDDDDGLEQYVRRAIDANDISWFPMNKAIRLRQAATKEESMLSLLDTRLHQTEGNVSQRLDRFHTDINIVLEQLNQTLKQDQADRSGESRATRTRQSAAFTPVDMQQRLALAAQQQLALSSSQPQQQPVSNNSNVNTGPVYYNRILFVQLIEISGIKVPLSALEDEIVAEITFENEDIQVVPVAEIHRHGVDFATDNCCKLLENLQPDDERSIHVRLVYRDPDSLEEKVLMQVEVPIDDLYMSENTMLEVYPPRSSSNDNKGDSKGKVVIMATIEKLVIDRHRKHSEFE